MARWANGDFTEDGLAGAGFESFIPLSLEGLDQMVRWAKTTGVRAVGMRTPSWDFSPHTLAIAKEMKLLYDSGMDMTEFFRSLALARPGEPPSASLLASCFYEEERRGGSCASEKGWEFPGPSGPKPPAASACRRPPGLPSASAPFGPLIFWLRFPLVLLTGVHEAFRRR